MGQMMGPLHPDATNGERLVYNALERISDDYQIWPELPIQAGMERKHPDFVLLHPKWGVIVLEVKDRRRIMSANPYKLVVRRRDGRRETEPNPVTIAKRYCDVIADQIRETYQKAVAEGAYLGPAPHIPRAYAVVMTLQAGHEIMWLEQQLKGRGRLLGKQDIVQERFGERLESLPRLGDVVPLDEHELELVRRALFPEGDLYDQSGRYIGHFTPEQEFETKDGVFTHSLEEAEVEEEASLEQPTLFPESSPGTIRPDVERLELTEQEEEIAERFSIRLVRGVAGSGKTQILCKRAVLLSKLYPTWDILVLTRNRGLAVDLEEILKDYGKIEVCNFDRLCRRQLEEKNLWCSPVNDTDQPGWIDQVCKVVPGADQFDSRFLRDEFNWMKYIGRLDRESYLAEPRDGREIPLSRENQRPVVFQVFERYEQRLRRFRQMVWADVPLITIDAMEGGLILSEQYDAILVDEAQMFPPTWFRVIKHWLKKPHGMLFLAADMTQNIYARFSWRQKGLNVRGRRSRVLRQSYRSSHPIARVKRLIDVGYWSSDIAAVSLKEVQRERLASHLRAQGVPIALSSEYRYGTDAPRVLVGLISGITGQEFKAVLVCEAQDLFDRSSTAFSGSWPEFKAQQKRLLYVAMTRARDDLHICYRQKLHSTLDALGEVTEAVEV